MYCLYGTGKPVERAYYYAHMLGPKVRSQLCTCRALRPAASIPRGSSRDQELAWISQHHHSPSEVHIRCCNRPRASVLNSESRVRDD